MISADLLHARGGKAFVQAAEAPVEAHISCFDRSARSRTARAPPVEVFAAIKTLRGVPPPPPPPPPPPTGLVRADASLFGAIRFDKRKLQQKNSEREVDRDRKLPRKATDSEGTTPLKAAARLCSSGLGLKIFLSARSAGAMLKCHSFPSVFSM